MHVGASVWRSILQVVLVVIIQICVRNGRSLSNLVVIESIRSCLQIGRRLIAVPLIIIAILMCIWRRLLRVFLWNEFLAGLLLQDC